MGFGNILSSTGISSSGLAAERLRMEVAANNIANANTTSTPEGGPYRRQQVRFGAVMNESLIRRNHDSRGLGGVQVLGVTPDQSELEKIYNPGHPDADANGMVAVPNVAIPMEMVDLMTSSRSYEANLKSITLFRKMAEQALSLMSPR